MKLIPVNNLHTTTNRQMPLELERFLPYRLNMLAETVSKAMQLRYGKRFGLSVGQWRVLAALGQHHTMTARDICNNSRMHKTKVSRAVAQLVKKGLVISQTNENDMRESLLNLTEDGERLYHDIVPEVLEFEGLITAGMKTRELNRLDKLLTDLLKRAEDLHLQQAQGPDENAER